MFKIYLTVPCWKGFFLPHLLLSIKFSVISKVKKFLVYTLWFESLVRIRVQSCRTNRGPVISRNFYRAKFSLGSIEIPRYHWAEISSAWLDAKIYSYWQVAAEYRSDGISVGIPVNALLYSNLNIFYRSGKLCSSIF